MTKEEFEQYLIDRDIDALIIKRFFESNVVIPKGSNRHPYADVLHEWIEGGKMEFKTDNNKWVCKPMVGYSFPSIEYRIKPQEPVFEWQYDTKLPDSTWQYYKEGDKTHFTDEEIGVKGNWLRKVEHTKRERK